METDGHRAVSGSSVSKHEVSGKVFGNTAYLSCSERCVACRLFGKCKTFATPVPFSDSRHSLSTNDGS